MKKEDEDENEDENEGFFGRLMQGKFRKKKKKKSKSAEKEQKSGGGGLMNFLTKPFRKSKHEYSRPITNNAHANEPQPGTSKDIMQNIGCTNNSRRRRNLNKQNEALEPSTSKKSPAEFTKRRRIKDEKEGSSKKKTETSSKKNIRRRKRDETSKKSTKHRTADEFSKGRTKKTRTYNEEFAKGREKSKKADKKKSRENVPTPADLNDPDEEFYFADNFRAGLRTLKKNFISRPYQSASMQKMLKRLAQRQKREETSSSIPDGETVAPGRRTMPPYEDYLPRPSAANAVTAVASSISLAGSSAIVATPVLSTERTEKETRMKTLAPENDDEDDFKKKYNPVVSNKTNHGNLFLSNGKPFWQGATGDDDEEETTDDELPMNADLIADVYEGKIHLVPMPSDPVTLNPYAPLSELRKRDEMFFTKDIIFSNTVRSMVNLNDELTGGDQVAENKNGKKKDKSVVSNRVIKPTFIEPTELIIYDRKDPSKVVGRPSIKNYRYEPNDPVASENGK